MYGYEAQPKNDRVIQVVERAIQRLIENGDNPSVAALNIFPVLRYLPRWFPGTGFHKIVDECREFTKEMLDIPFEYARKCMVSAEIALRLLLSYTVHSYVGVARREYEGVDG